MQRNAAERAKREETAARESAEAKVKGDRLAKLKDAFGVKSTSEESGVFTPQAMVFEPETIRLAQQYGSMVRELETALREMVVDPSRGRLTLPPVNREKRMVQHAVARSFGLESQAYDQEPHRHIEVSKAPFSQVYIPKKLLSQVAASPTALHDAIDALVQQNALMLSEVNRETTDIAQELRGWHGQYSLGWLDANTAVASFETPELMKDALAALGGGKRGAFTCRLAIEDPTDTTLAPKNRVMVVSENEEFVGANGRLVSESWETLHRSGAGPPKKEDSAPPEDGHVSQNMWAALEDDVRD